MAATDIAGLAWQPGALAALPVDPSDDPRPRQVYAACHSRVVPTPVRAPSLQVLEPAVAALLGLDPTPTPELLAVLAGNCVLPQMAPHAACYGGHQFGSWAGQLGDGRAIGLGTVAGADGHSWEVQLKGAGPTPYARHADGRAVLRSSLRELVASEAMWALGVPTSRALALVTSGETVMRDRFYSGDPRPEPGAVICRVAPSFLRFGSFELAASRGDLATLRALTEYLLSAHFPQLGRLNPTSLVQLFDAICGHTRAMLVHWLRVGFVHGVMNTDNMSVLGLALDYGPYGFLDVFERAWTPNTSDGESRYAYGQQAAVGLWNLWQLANAWAPLMDTVAPLEAALMACAQALEVDQARMWAAKLGLVDLAVSGSLVADLLPLLERLPTDMTLFFRCLATLEAEGSPAAARACLQPAFYAPVELAPGDAAAWDAWLASYLAALCARAQPAAARRQAMNAVNPMLVPRQHLLEAAIVAAEGGDWQVLASLRQALRTPYLARPLDDRHVVKPTHREGADPRASMLSCSS